MEFGISWLWYSIVEDYVEPIVENPMSKKIIQVPIDAELLAALNACSDKEGRSRADVIRDACRVYLRRREEEELDRIYIEGYRRIPDDRKIAEAQEAMLGDILEPEEW